MHLVDQIKAKARESLQTVVLPESYDDRMIEAAGQIVADGLAKVVLLGDPAALEAKAKELGASLEGVELIDPKTSAALAGYVDELVVLREKKGMTPEQAKESLTAEDNLFYGAMMVRKGDAGGMVAGAFNTTGDVLRAAFQVIGRDVDVLVDISGAERSPGRPLARKAQEQIGRDIGRYRGNNAPLVNQPDKREFPGRGCFRFAGARFLARA